MEVTEVRWQRLRGHAGRVAGGYAGRAEFFRGKRLLMTTTIVAFPTRNRLALLANDATMARGGDMFCIPGGWCYLAKPGRTLSISVSKANAREKGGGMQIEWIMYLRQPDGAYGIDFGANEKVVARIRTLQFQVRKAIVDLVAKAVDEGKGSMHPQLEGWYFACHEGQTVEVPFKRRRKADAGA